MKVKFSESLKHDLSRKDITIGFVSASIQVLQGYDELAPEKQNPGTVSKETRVKSVYNSDTGQLNITLDTSGFKGESLIDANFITIYYTDLSNPKTEKPGIFLYSQPSQDNNGTKTFPSLKLSYGFNLIKIPVRIRKEITIWSPGNGDDIRFLETFGGVTYRNILVAEDTDLVSRRSLEDLVKIKNLEYQENSGRSRNTVGVSKEGKIGIIKDKEIIREYKKIYITNPGIDKYFNPQTIRGLDQRNGGILEITGKVYFEDYEINEGKSRMVKSGYQSLPSCPGLSIVQKSKSLERLEDPVISGTRIKYKPLPSEYIGRKDISPALIFDISVTFQGLSGNEETIKEPLRLLQAEKEGGWYVENYGTDFFEQGSPVYLIGSDRTTASIEFKYTDNLEFSPGKLKITVPPQISEYFSASSSHYDGSDRVTVTIHRLSRELPNPNVPFPDVNLTYENMIPVTVEFNSIVTRLYPIAIPGTSGLSISVDPEDISEKEGVDAITYDSGSKYFVWGGNGEGDAKVTISSMPGEYGNRTHFIARTRDENNRLLGVKRGGQVGRDKLQVYCRKVNQVSTRVLSGIISIYRVTQDLSENPDTIINGRDWRKVSNIGSPIELKIYQKPRPPRLVVPEEIRVTNGIDWYSLGIDTNSPVKVDLSEVYSLEEDQKDPNHITRKVYGFRFPEKLDSTGKLTSITVNPETFPIKLFYQNFLYTNLDPSEPKKVGTITVTAQSSEEGEDYQAITKTIDVFQNSISPREAPSTDNNNLSSDRGSIGMYESSRLGGDMTLTPYLPSNYNSRTANIILPGPRDKKVNLDHGTVNTKVSTSFFAGVSPGYWEKVARTKDSYGVGTKSVYVLGESQPENSLFPIPLEYKLGIRGTKGPGMSYYIFKRNGNEGTIGTSSSFFNSGINIHRLTLGRNSGYSESIPLIISNIPELVNGRLLKLRIEKRGGISENLDTELVSIGDSHNLVVTLTNNISGSVQEGAVISLYLDINEGVELKDFLSTDTGMVKGDLDFINTGDKTKILDFISHYLGLRKDRKLLEVNIQLRGISTFDTFTHFIDFRGGSSERIIEWRDDSGGEGNKVNVNVVESDFLDEPVPRVVDYGSLSKIIIDVPDRISYRDINIDEDGGNDDLYPSYLPYRVESNSFGSSIAQRYLDIYFGERTVSMDITVPSTGETVRGVQTKQNGLDSYTLCLGSSPSNYNLYFREKVTQEGLFTTDESYIVSEINERVSGGTSELRLPIKGVKKVNRNGAIEGIDSSNLVVSDSDHYGLKYFRNQNLDTIGLLSSEEDKYQLSSNEVTIDLSAEEITVRLPVDYNKTKFYFVLGYSDPDTNGPMALINITRETYLGKVKFTDNTSTPAIFKWDGKLTESIEFRSDLNPGDLLLKIGETIIPGESLESRREDLEHVYTVSENYSMNIGHNNRRNFVEGFIEVLRSGSNNVIGRKNYKQGYLSMLLDGEISGRILDNPSKYVVDKEGQSEETPKNKRITFPISIYSREVLEESEKKHTIDSSNLVVISEPPVSDSGSYITSFSETVIVTSSSGYSGDELPFLENRIRFNDQSKETKDLKYSINGVVLYYKLPGKNSGRAAFRYSIKMTKR